MDRTEQQGPFASLKCKVLCTFACVIALFGASPVSANAAVIGESLPMWGTLNAGDSIRQTNSSGTMQLVMESDGNLVLYRVTRADGTPVNEVCDFSGTSGVGLHADFIVDTGIGPILRVADENGTTRSYWEGASTGGAMNVSFNGAQIYIGNALWSPGNSTGCF